MVKEDGSEAFIRLIEDNTGIIRKIAGAYTTTYHDREDLVHEMVMELWKAFPHFKGAAKISTWIYRIALNTALNEQRKEQKKSRISTSHPKLYWLTEPDSRNSEELSLLYHSIQELNEVNKMIILLHLEGNSHAEIAAVTGMSITNVGTRMARIREQLKTLVTQKNK